MNTAEMTKKLRPIATQYKLDFIVLFGSAAKGTMTDMSDIDIAVLQQQAIPLTTQQFFDLMDEFTTRTNEPRKIDLVDLATANPLLRYEAIMNGKLLYGNELAFAEYKLFAFKDYIDSQSLFDLEKKLILKRQRILAKLILQPTLIYTEPVKV